MIKKYGELHLEYTDGLSVTYQNVTNFNLIDGNFYIWFYRGKSVIISRKLIHNFYYAYTPY